MGFSIVEIIFLFWISLLIWILIEFLLSKRNKHEKFDVHKKISSADNNIDQQLK